MWEPWRKEENTGGKNRANKRKKMKDSGSRSPKDPSSKNLEHDKLGHSRSKSYDNQSPKSSDNGIFGSISKIWHGFGGKHSGDKELIEQPGEEDPDLQLTKSLFPKGKLKEEIIDVYDEDKDESQLRFSGKFVLDDTPQGYRELARSRNSSPRSRNGTPRSKHSSPRSKQTTPRSKPGSPRSKDGTPRSRRGSPRPSSADTTPRSKNNSPRSKEGTPRLERSGVKISGRSSLSSGGKSVLSSSSGRGNLSSSGKSLLSASAKNNLSSSKRGGLVLSSKSRNRNRDKSPDYREEQEKIKHQEGSKDNERSNDIESPKSIDIESPKSADIESPKSKNNESSKDGERSKDIESPKSKDIESSKSTDGESTKPALGDSPKKILRIIPAETPKKNSKTTDIELINIEHLTTSESPINIETPTKKESPAGEGIRQPTHEKIIQIEPVKLADSEVETIKDSEVGKTAQIQLNGVGAKLSMRSQSFTWTKSGSFNNSGTSSPKKSNPTYLKNSDSSPLRNSGNSQLSRSGSVLLDKSESPNSSSPNFTMSGSASLSKIPLLPLNLLHSPKSSPNMRSPKEIKTNKDKETEVKERKEIVKENNEIVKERKVTNEVEEITVKIKSPEIIRAVIESLTVKEEIIENPESEPRQQKTIGDLMVLDILGPKKSKSRMVKGSKKKKVKNEGDPKKQPESDTKTPTETITSVEKIIAIEDPKSSCPKIEIIPEPEPEDEEKAMEEYRETMKRLLSLRREEPKMIYYNINTLEREDRVIWGGGGSSTLDLGPNPFYGPSYYDLSFQDNSLNQDQSNNREQSLNQDQTTDKRYVDDQERMEDKTSDGENSIDESQEFFQSEPELNLDIQLEIEMKRLKDLKLDDAELSLDYSLESEDLDSVPLRTKGKSFLFWRKFTREKSQHQLGSSPYSRSNSKINKGKDVKINYPSLDMSLPDEFSLLKPNPIETIPKLSSRPNRMVSENLIEISSEIDSTIIINDREPNLKENNPQIEKENSSRIEKERNKPEKDKEEIMTEKLGTTEEEKSTGMEECLNLFRQTVIESKSSDESQFITNNNQKSKPIRIRGAKENRSSQRSVFANDQNADEVECLIIEERNNEVLEIEQAVIDVKEIMDELAVQVNRQGETVDRAAFLIEDACENTDLAILNLEEAEQKESWKNGLKFAALAVGGLFVALGGGLVAKTIIDERKNKPK